MDQHKLSQQVQQHELSISTIKQDIKYQFDDVKKTIANLPHQFQQEMSLKWAERDEQKRRDQAEVRRWFWGLIVALILASAGFWLWLLHERDTVKDDHVLIGQANATSKESIKLANQADHKSDQALNSVTKINDKLDLVIYFHKKQYKE